MIYTPNTRKAMIIAYNAHHGQKDKSGLPYIHHPLHLAEQMPSEETCIVALLHDVVEDTDITFDYLKKEFSSEIIHALELLTHDKSVDYFEYIKKIKNNPIAKTVKIADLHHNSDKSRLDNPTEKDLKRYIKYEKALKILSD